MRARRHLRGPDHPPAWRRKELEDLAQGPHRIGLLYLGGLSVRLCKVSLQWVNEWSRSVVSDSLQPYGRWLPGSSVHRIFQARVTEWVAITFSRGSSRPRDRTQVSRIAGRYFTLWATVLRVCKWQPTPVVFPDSSAGKESTCNAGDPSWIPGSGRCPGEGIGYPPGYSWTSLVAQLVKNCPQWGRPRFDPWVGKIPWRRERLPTPLF